MIERIVAAVGLLAGAIGWTLSAATENVTLVGAGSFTAFALAGFGLMWRAWAKENARLVVRLNAADGRADRSEYREAILVRVIREHNLTAIAAGDQRCPGVELPVEYYQWPPQEVAS